MALVYRGRRGRGGGGGRGGRGRGGGGFRGRGRGWRGHRGGGQSGHSQFRGQRRKTFSPEKTRLCHVCKVADHKYRCPQCSAQYCSVVCFKNHKPKCLVDDLDIENDSEDEWKAASAAAAAAVKPALAELSAHERKMAIKRGETRQEGEIELFSSESGSSDDDDDEDDDVANLGDLNPDRLANKDLKNLAQSSRLKTLLTNPHLRNLILEVDQAEDKNSIMQAAMQEPLFVEMADACLQAVQKKSN